jgi:rSAM/selenodomain-associated transferase 2
MISVIIPTLNEERALPLTLARLFCQSGSFETIVCDGGSSDGTRAIVAKHPQIQWLDAPRGRASQMNAGAQQARGEWLVFLHADTLLPEQALATIAALPSVCHWGAFRQRFSGATFWLRAISWIDNMRCRITRVPYGDQVIFVRRHTFLRAGGFPAVEIMEDLLFGERMRRVHPPLLLRAEAITDSRKFEQMGVLVSFWRVLRILAAHHRRRAIPARDFFSDIR